MRQRMLWQVRVIFDQLSKVSESETESAKSSAARENVQRWHSTIAAPVKCDIVCHSGCYQECNLSYVLTNNN